MLQRPLRMLIVDDSADDAELMSRALRQGGFAPECVRVDTADAVASALAEERGWDVIACDYRLPRLDAARVLHTARAALPVVPILLVCGRYPPDLWHEIGSGLISQFVSKDRLAELPEVITALLRTREHAACSDPTDGPMR